MSQIGVTGLAVMGANLARNIARRGVPIAVHNRTASKTRDFMAEYVVRGRLHAARESLEEFVAALERPRRIIVMVKAGKPVDGVIDDLVPLLDEGDIIIDAGNSHFVDTRRRESELTEQGLRFIGTGVSGGEEGALNGPVDHARRPARGLRRGRGDLHHDRRAGRRQAVLRLHRRRRRGPLREDGPQRHRVRRHAADRRGLRPAAPRHRARRRRRSRAIFDEWNAGDLESFLIEITATVLGKVDAETGKPLVDVIVDQAEQKGTGRWTAQDALELGVPLTAITEAVFARSLSRAARPAAATRPASLAGPEAGRR